MSIPGRVSVLVIAVLAVPAATAVAQEWTEQQILEIALRDGPRAQAIRAGAEVTRAEQQARTVLPNPAFVYSREGAGFTEFFQIEQSLPLWGTRGALRRAGVAATAAADAEREAQLWTLRADVRRVVAELVASQDAARGAEAARRELEALVERLRIREREGEGSRYDRLRAERELVEAARTIAEARIRAAESGAQLVAVLPAGHRLLTIAPVPLREESIPSSEALWGRAREARPELIALQRTIERFGYEADAARRARLPQPSVTAGVKRAEVETARETSGAIGVHLTLPLFDTGRRDAARWQVERRRAEAEATALTQRLYADVTRAAEVLAIRREAATAYERRTRQDSETLKQIAHTGYSEGELSLLELMDAYRADWDARSQAITLRLQVTLAEIELERAVGAAIWP